MNPPGIMLLKPSGATEMRNSIVEFGHKPSTLSIDPVSGSHLPAWRSGWLARTSHLITVKRRLMHAPKRMLFTSELTVMPFIVRVPVLVISTEMLSS